MHADPFQIIFLVGYLFYMFAIYGRSARRYRRERIATARSRPLDITLDMITFAGWQIIPLVYIFSAWLDFADYSLPDWAGWTGAIIFGGALTVLFQAYTTLGRNWSPKIDVLEGQSLVTDGIYRDIRHPIYTGMWLWAAATPLLLQNWIAGFAFLVTFTPLYFIRVPQEEKVLRDKFGKDYETYMLNTGRVIPRLRR
jgi:protein-S-isoprenylcysteine O-methyltransferase Ste14